MLKFSIFITEISKAKLAAYIPAAQKSVAAMDDKALKGISTKAETIINHKIEDREGFIRTAKNKVKTNESVEIKENLDDHHEKMIKKGLASIVHFPSLSKDHVEKLHKHPDYFVRAKVASHSKLEPHQVKALKADKHPLVRSNINSRKEYK